MENALSTFKFIVVHMLQEEIILALTVTALLFWLLNKRLAVYSLKTKEARLSRQLALATLLLVPVIFIIGRIFR